jgi:hypothetical protein
MRSPRAGPVQQRYRCRCTPERWELGFGTLIETISRARAGIGRVFHHTPTGAH